MINLQLRLRRNAPPPPVNPPPVDRVDEPVDEATAVLHNRERGEVAVAETEAVANHDAEVKTDEDEEEEEATPVVAPRPPPVNPWAHRNKQIVRLLDGSFSTELKKFGYDPDAHPNWTVDANLTHAMYVKTIHTKYFELGVDKLTTNTYHAYSLDTKRMRDMLYKGCDILIDAKVKKYAHVERMYSIGPYATRVGGATEYAESYPLEDGMTLHQLKCKFYYYYDLMIHLMTDAACSTTNFLFETIPSLMEARVIRDRLSSKPHQAGVISFTCKDGTSLRHGDSFADAVRELSTCPQVIGIGINCTRPKFILPLLQSIPWDEISKQCEIWVYPNDGLFDGEKEEAGIFRTSLFNLTKEWAQNGASVIGGCCGVDCGDLFIMRKAIDEWNKENGLLLNAAPAPAPAENNESDPASSERD